MKSRFDLPFNFPNEFNMIVEEDVDLSTTSDIKVSIPSIITNSKSSILYTLQKSIYINDDCPRLSKSTISDQSYMTATINSNSFINDMNDIDSNFSYILKKGDILRGRFLNNKIDKLSYSITGITKGGIK